jgi:DsbC/DsbD-like thiol-disulfide interchange protein
MGATLSLIGGTVAAGEGRFGIRVDLEPGWKTYWRYPGDSGIAPMIATDGSVNVASATLSYPAPVRMSDPSGQSIGYHGTVVFPLVVTLADATKPARLVVRIDLGLCKDICIPAHAELARLVPVAARASVRDSAVLAAHEARVPQPTRPEHLHIAAIDPEPATPPALIVTLRGTLAARPDLDLFAEGPNARWALPLPERIATTDDSSRWRVVLDGIPRADLPARGPLRLTAATPEGGVELDLALPSP